MKGKNKNRKAPITPKEHMNAIATDLANGVISPIQAFKASNIRYLIQLLVDTRLSFFGYGIELFDFYTYGTINSVAPKNIWLTTQNSTEQLARENHDPRRFYQLIKMDSTIEHISAGATSSYVSALLPKGVESITFTLIPEDEQSPTMVEEAKNTGNAVRKVFIDCITTGLPTFMQTMYRLIRDYTDYGNCVCLHGIEKGTFYLKHIPFKHSYMWSSHDDKTFVFMHQESLLKHEFLARYPEYSRSISSAGGYLMGRRTVEISHIYLNGTEILLANTAGDMTGVTNEIAEHLMTLKIPPNGVMHVVYDEINNRVVAERTLPYNPVLWAKNNTIAGVFGGYSGASGTMSNQYMTPGMPASGSWGAGIYGMTGVKLDLYGRGAGIQSLSSIVNANLSLQLKTIGSILSVHPAILLPLGTILNKGKEVVEGHLDISPGRTNTITSDNMASITQATSTGNMQVISQPQLVIGSFQENYEMHIRQIENAYNTEIFSVISAPNQTATEVIQRQQQSARQFRGQASPFYSELLRPLLHLIFNAMQSGAAHNLSITKAQRELVDSVRGLKYKIDIFSFEDEQLREIKAAKTEKYLATLVQLASAGIPVPDLETKITNLLKDLDDAMRS